MLTAEQAGKIAWDMALQVRDRIDVELVIQGFKRVDISAVVTLNRDEKPMVRETAVRLKPFDLEGMQDRRDKTQLPFEEDLTQLVKLFLDELMKTRGENKTYYAVKWVDMIPARYDDNDEVFGVVAYCLGVWAN